MKTKVKGTNWNQPLSDWLADKMLANDAEGAVEDAQACARGVAEVLGGLLQLLVDRKQLTHEECFSIIGLSDYNNKPELVEEAE